MLRGAIEPGVHYADSVLDPARMLTDLEPVATVVLTDAVPRIDVTAPIFEEGAL
jgi:hypothetical protein